MRYPITPTPKPRMTQRDKWAKRPSVLRYRAFADECRLLIHTSLDRKAITFFIPMPKSWSKKKKAAMVGQPHRQRPDIDNYAKAVLDALYEDDSGVAEIHLKKVWAVDGAIDIRELP